MKKMNAMVLAGGKGTRMDLLCKTRPKPMLPFAGKHKVIDFSLNNCINSEISNIAVIMDYQRYLMRDYLSRWQMKNSGKAELHILEPRNGSYTGTADAVFRNLDYLENSPEDTVLVLAGDHVYNLDYRKIEKLHRSRKADVTVGVIRVPLEEADRFGTLTADEDGRITHFMEKTPFPRSNLASMGIYLFDKDILIKRLKEDAENPDSKHDFGYSIIPGMVKNDRAFACHFEGYWRDIGTVAAYYEANMETFDPIPEFIIDNNIPIIEKSYPRLRIDERAVIRNSVISAGCVIKGRVENSVLSPGVWVDEDAVIKNSVVLNDAFIGYHSVVDHTIVDEDVTINEYCYVGFGSSNDSDELGLSILGREANIPSHTAIGTNCKIQPYVEQKDFSSSVVLADTVIYRGGARVLSLLSR